MLVDVLPKGIHGLALVFDEVDGDVPAVVVYETNDESIPVDRGLVCWSPDVRMYTFQRLASSGSFGVQSWVL